MRKHKHSAKFWDGYYEHCKCGACAGDKRNPVTGSRYIAFDEWPDE